LAAASDANALARSSRASGIDARRRMQRRLADYLPASRRAKLERLAQGSQSGDRPLARGA
jgi:hypothetical protein